MDLCRYKAEEGGIIWLRVAFSKIISAQKIFYLFNQTVMFSFKVFTNL